MSPKLLWALCPFILGVHTGNAQNAEPELPSPIDYQAALRLALENDPRLSLNALEAEAAEGQVEQASLRPNPVVEAEAENFLGSGPAQGVEGLEVTLGIGQLIETAGKREKRTELARRERELLDWEREAAIAEIESDVRQAFVSLLVVQETLELRREQLSLAEASEDETSRLVEAARAPEVDRSRARLATRREQFAVSRAERALRASRVELAALWGRTSPPEFEVEGEVSLEAELPTFEELTNALPQTASLARYEAVSRNREAALELEKAHATPDVEVFAGGRYTREGDGHGSVVLGVSVPWPLFDQNQGNIRSAQAKLRAVERERAVAQRRLLTELSTAYQELLAAHAEARSIEADLLPAAQEALSDTEEGYARGQFDQLAVLDSRQALFETREAYLDALSRYTTAFARIKALTRPAALNR